MLGSTSQAQHEVERALLLDVVVLERPAVLVISNKYIRSLSYCIFLHSTKNRLRMATHAERDGVMGKECRRCYTWKPLIAYYSKGTTTYDGKDSMCKVCFNNRKKDRANGIVLIRSDEHRTLNGIEHKHCPTCNKWKALLDYTKCKSRKDGLQGLCKACFKDARMKYRNSEKGRGTETKYAKEHVKDARKRDAKRYSENKAKILAKQVKYHVKRYRNDAAYRTRICISSRINKVLKKNCKRKHTATMKLIGCSKNQLMCHLEKQFDEYMNWNNHGRWHIDHIIPCNAFDTKNAYEAVAMWHYTNLAPLWAKDNILKRDHYTKDGKKQFLRNWCELCF